jgi:hypothetical protein
MEVWSVVWSVEVKALWRRLRFSAGLSAVYNQVGCSRIPSGFDPERRRERVPF